MSDRKSADTPPNLFDPALAACPHSAYQSLLDHHPVHRNAISNAPIISRYEDVMYCLRHPEIFSSDMEEQMSLGTDRPMIPQQIDPPAQTRYRKLLDPRFSHKRTLELEPSLRASAKALIDEFADAGECDFSQQFAVPLRGQAFLQIYGLPLEGLGHLIELKDGIIRPQSQAENPLDSVEVEDIRKASGRKIYDYVEDLIAERRSEPREDLMSYLLQVELDGDRLSHNEILDISFLFILGGLDTVTASLSCSIAHLATNPEARKLFSQESKDIDSAIEELLRWETPVTGIPRLVKKTVTIGDTRIEEGEMVMLLLGAANLDPREFEGADRIDFDSTRNRHVAFGGGPHRCLGSHLARMELRIGLQEWHRRIPEYRVKDGETLVYSPGIRDIRHLPLIWN